MPWEEWMKPQQWCRLQTHTHWIRCTDAVKGSGKNIPTAPSNGCVYSALTHWVKTPFPQPAQLLRCKRPPIRLREIQSTQRPWFSPFHSSALKPTTFGSPWILQNHASSRSLATAHPCNPTESVYSSWELILYTPRMDICQKMLS